MDGQEVAVDACCLLNLLAAREILRPPSVAGKKAKQSASSVLDVNMHVPQDVIKETLYLLTSVEDSEELVRTVIDLEPFLHSGLLHVCNVEGEEESELYVNFATQLDDGEAACLAIGAARGWTVATDDRIARRVACENNVNLISTPELVKRWSDRAKVTKKQLSAVLQNIRKFARFAPSPGTPESDWWLKNLAG